MDKLQSKNAKSFWDEQNINIFKTKYFCFIGSYSKSFDFDFIYKSAKSIVTDISKEAIYIAKKNAIFNNTYNQMQFICCDWLSCFKNLNFDILISNPPYIKRSEIKILDDEVKNFDPLISLDGGADGLSSYKEILDGINKIGKKNLLVLFEIGFDQSKQVTDMMKKQGFSKIQIFNDYCNIPRCILGKV